MSGFSVAEGGAERGQLLAIPPCYIRFGQPVTSPNADLMNAAAALPPFVTLRARWSETSRAPSPPPKPCRDLAVVRGIFSANQGNLRTRLQDRRRGPRAADRGVSHPGLYV